MRARTLASFCCRYALLPYAQRGDVFRDGIPVADVIQTWLDVSAHLARGAEQAAELEHGILANAVEESA